MVAGGALAKLALLLPLAFAVILIITMLHQTYREAKIFTSGVLNRDSIVRDCLTSSPMLVRSPGHTVFPIGTIQGNNHGEENAVRVESFKQIYEKRTWGTHIDQMITDVEASGPTSTLHWVQETVGTLHQIVTEIKARLGKSRVSILDMPCGDMIWMSRFLETRNDIDYTGMDVVPAIIQHHHAKYNHKPWKFHVHDAVTSPLNTSYDLVISRLVLPHLLVPDVMKFIKHVSDSGSSFFLTTTYPEWPVNKDLQSTEGARFRPLNLEVQPISLSPPLCIVKDGLRGPHSNPYMGLWRLPLTQVDSCKIEDQAKVLPIGVRIYSCTKMESSVASAT